MALAIEHVAVLYREMLPPVDHWYRRDLRDDDRCSELQLWPVPWSLCYYVAHVRLYVLRTEVAPILTPFRVFVQSHRSQYNVTCISDANTWCTAGPCDPYVSFLRHMSPA